MTTGPSTPNGATPDPQELLAQLQALLAQQQAAQQPPAQPVEQAPAAQPVEQAPAAQPVAQPDLAAQLAQLQALLAQQQAAQQASPAPAAQTPVVVQPTGQQPDLAAQLAQLQALVAQQQAAALQPAQPVQQPVQAVQQPAQPVQAVQQPAQPAQPAVQAQWAPQPEAPKKKSKKGIVLVFTSIAAVAALVLAGLVGTGILRFGPGPTTGGEGEVFLISASDLGPDPFSTTSLAPEVPEVAASVAVASTGVAQPAAGTGLYGGSGDVSVCSPAGQIAFLDQNPSHKLAFVTALNADPDVKLRDGSKVTVDNVGDYIGELTSIVLLSDTRVTNHGYWEGQPTTLQAVLQAGTAVMVDQYGVPRVKCNCGNPLLPPVPTSTTPNYTGEPWPGWNGDPNTIDRSTTIIEQFPTTDITTGEAGTTDSNNVACEGAKRRNDADMIARNCPSGSSGSSGSTGDETTEPEPEPTPSLPVLDPVDPVEPASKICAVDWATWDWNRGYVPSTFTVTSQAQVQLDLWLWQQEAGTNSDDCTGGPYYQGTILPGETFVFDSTEGYVVQLTSPGIGDYGSFVTPANGGEVVLQ